MTNRNNDSWSQTYKGNIIKYDDLENSTFDIEDIAHALSLTCRYNGHVPEFYSVAEHCILAVEEALAENTAFTCLYILMHDAGEAYLNDIARPCKHLIPGYCELENNIQEVIELKLISEATQTFIENGNKKRIIKYFDELLLFAEKERFFPVTAFKWKLSHHYSKERLCRVAKRIQPMSPKRAERRFLKMYIKLRDEVSSLNTDHSRASESISMSYIEQVYQHYENII